MKEGERQGGNKEEDLEIVRNIYGTENPFYAGFTGVQKDYQKILDEADREEASMTDDEEVSFLHPLQSSQQLTQIPQQGTDDDDDVAIEEEASRGGAVTIDKV